MPRAVTLGEEIADDWFLCQCRKCDGGDELLTSRGNDNLHLSTSLDKPTDNHAGLVGCYRTRNA